MFKVLIGIVLIAVLVFGLAYGFTDARLEFPMQGPEQPSPTDRIDVSQIVMSDNGLIVKGITNIRLVSLADTNSMDPVLDTEATAIEIIPSDVSVLHVGDIISYKSGTNTIIHRIVSISSDGEWYATAKGDNNPVADDGKIRFEQIKGVVVGILY